MRCLQPADPGELCSVIEDDRFFQNRHHPPRLLGWRGEYTMTITRIYLSHCPNVLIFLSKFLLFSSDGDMFLFFSQSFYYFLVMETCIACNQQIRVNYVRSSRTTDSFKIVITCHNFLDGVVSIL
jgi:hypothetical protein